MKFYDTKAAPNARRVRIFLAEKGISVPTEVVDLAKMEHKSEDYARVNPLQRVPALVLDDGTVITESIAICRYFEETNPTPPLFGTDAKSRAVIEMWQRRIELLMMMPTAMVFRHTHPAMAAMENPQVPEIAANNRPRVTEFMAFLNTTLADREFIAGDTYSLADITGLIACDFLRLARVPISPEQTHLSRWHAALQARPSAAA